MHFTQPPELRSATKTSEASTSWNPNLRGHQRRPLTWCLNRLGKGSLETTNIVNALLLLILRARFTHNYKRRVRFRVQICPGQLPQLLLAQPCARCREVDDAARPCSVRNPGNCDLAACQWQGGVASGTRPVNCQVPEIGGPGTRRLPLTAWLRSSQAATPKEEFVLTIGGNEEVSVRPGMVTLPGSSSQRPTATRVRASARHRPVRR